jgi:hypothetical protein
LKTILGLIGVAAAGAGYTVMILMTAAGTGEGLSFATFLLWSALAWINTISTKKQSGSWIIPLMYSIGATTTTIVLIIKGRYGWSVFDTVVAILVIVCVILWLAKGDRWAIVSSTTASFIAALPFLIMTWKNPSVSPITPNTLFLLANFLGFIAAKKWTLQDRLYLGSNVVVCGSLVLFYWLPR